MVFGVYCVRDLKAGFQTPVIQVNDDVAVRGFASVVSKGDSLMSDHPGDFALFRIGDFDADTGKLVPLDLLRLLAEARDYVKEV